MTELRFTAIPTPAQAEDGQEHFAVSTPTGYAGWIESHPAARRGDPAGARRWAAYGPDGARVGRWFVSRGDAATALADLQRAPSSAPRDAPRPHTALYVTGAELTTLQALAAALGYRTRRGPHAGERGSVTALAAALARAAERNRPFTVAVLRGLLASSGDEG